MTQWLVTLLQNHPLLMLAFFGFLIASQWMVFAKARQPGWAVLIPFYGQIVHARVAGLPWWMGLMVWVPILNVLAVLALSMGVAKRFGKSPLFGLGLFAASPIFTPVLAFGNSRYRLHG